MASMHQGGLAIKMASVAMALLCSPTDKSEAQMNDIDCGASTGRAEIVETERYRIVAVAPLFRINLVLEIDDWPELRSVLKEFAVAHGWIVRDQSEVRPSVLKLLYVDLCAKNGLRFSVSEQRWAARDYASANPGYGLLLPLYGDVPEDVWQPVAAEMVRLLEMHWPGRVRFRDGDGYLIERPDFIDTEARSRSE